MMNGQLLLISGIDDQPSVAELAARVKSLRDLAARTERVSVVYGPLHASGSQDPNEWRFGDAVVAFKSSVATVGDAAKAALTPPFSTSKLKQLNTSVVMSERIWEQVGIKANAEVDGGSLPEQALEVLGVARAASKGKKLLVAAVATGIALLIAWPLLKGLKKSMDAHSKSPGVYPHGPYSVPTPYSPSRHSAAKSNSVSHLGSRRVTYYGVYDF